MDRKTDTTINWLLFTVLAWVIANKLDHERPHRVALAAGPIAAVITWFGYEKPAFLAATDQ